MHYENNVRSFLFTFVYISCIIIIGSCNNESRKTDTETHDLSTEKPIESNGSNNNIVSRGYLNSSDTSTEVKSVFLEGGSTVPVKTGNIKTTTTSRTSTPNDSPNGKKLELESLSSGPNDSNPTDIKPHKGRKGVKLDEINSEETPTDKTALDDLLTIESRKEPGESLNNTIPRTIMSTVNSTTQTAFNLPAVNSQIVKQLVDSVDKSLNGSAVSRDSKNGTNQEIITGSKSSKAPKPVTRDDGDIDNSSYSLTASESDYIIPIVATVFAAPLLIVLGMFLYKRSKEFWERRHYRRMDFLIDGMYND